MKVSNNSKLVAAVTMGTLAVLTMLIQSVSKSPIAPNSLVDHGARRLMEDTATEVGILRTPRVLVGIFTQDNAIGFHQRRAYRRTLSSQRDGRVCSLAEFLNEEEFSKPNVNRCIILYTFVVGQMTGEITEIFDETVTPLTLERQVTTSRQGKDLDEADVTRLNVRENTGEGKSQTFLYFASTLMKRENLSIDYCMKVSPDSFLNVPQLLMFQSTELPPAPFNRGIFGGSLRDKSFWSPMDHQKHQINVQREGTSGTAPINQLPMTPPPPESILPRLESFWGNEFDGVHLYLAGYVYVLSRDLVEFCVGEIPYAKTRLGPGGYLEGQEDHDISSMAFHSPTPVQIIAISRDQRFWEAPILNEDRWDEVARSLSTAS